MFFVKAVVYLSLLFEISSSLQVCHAKEGVQGLQNAHLQFFGDLYLSYRAIKETKSSVHNPNMFKNITHLLSSAKHNIVNFEGVATTARMPKELKSYLLKMPTWVGKNLYKANIKYASLANNHSLDYGSMGLFDSLTLLSSAGIRTFGAGMSLNEATQPLVISDGQRFICMLAFNRTLPTSFWAKKDQPGSAFLDYQKTRDAIRVCKKNKYFTIVSFHWGVERTHTPKAYQKELAHLSINAGADMVIGHHPHVLQSIEIYKSKPIFYSLGNFAFSSYTLHSPQQGMSVRVKFPKDTTGKKRPTYDLVPLNVQNKVVKFHPRHFKNDEENPLEAFIPDQYCKKHSAAKIKATYYHCRF
ncbi:MAG: CapA family protein [Bdellovibrionota bacterium]